MSKFFCLFFVSLLLSVSFVVALDVGYVVKTTSSLSSDEQAVRDFISGEGHTVSVIDDSSFDPSVYDIVVVSESVSDIKSYFDHTTTSTLFMSNSAARLKGLSGSSGFGSDRNARIEKSEGITDGYSLGSVQVYSVQDSMDFLSGCFPVNSDILVSKSDSTKAVILALDVDSLLIDSSCTDRDKTISSRNLYFGLTDAASWNSNGEELFRRSIDWLGESANTEAPVITSFSPSDTAPNVVDSADTTFSVVYTDADNFDDVEVEWKLDGSVVSSGNTYIFNQVVGSYDLIAVVDDGRFEVEQAWDIEVVSSSSLTCSASGGDICTSTEVCTGSTLSVSDSSSCCSVTCTQEVLDFSKADVCSATDSDIDIDFINLSNGRDYDIGEKISFTIRIRNNLDENKDFDVTAYLYDLTDNKVVEKDKKTASINDGKNDIIGFEFNGDSDLDADNDYAILVVAEDDECNQEYRKINIIREDNEVSVTKIDVAQSDLSCGGPLDLSVYVKNIGNEDQDVYVKVKNSQLGIDEQTDGFELERFDGKDDSEKKKFNFTIPDNVKSGTYTIRAELYYGNQRDFFDKIVTLGACGNEEVVEPSEDIVLGSDIDVERAVAEAINEDVQEGDLGTDGGSSVFRNIFLVILLVFLGVAGFVVYRNL